MHSMYFIELGGSCKTSPRTGTASCPWERKDEEGGSGARQASSFLGGGKLYSEAEFLPSGVVL